MQRHIILALLMFFLSPIMAQPSNNLHQDNPEYCRLNISADTDLYMAGGIGGTDLNGTLSEGGVMATGFNLYVNKPGRKVALLLTAIKPSIWNLKWSDGTTIEAVYISGHHRQILNGTPLEADVIISTDEGGGDCGVAYIGENGSLDSIKLLSIQVFNRAADDFVKAVRGSDRIEIGDRLSGANQHHSIAISDREDFPRTLLLDRSHDYHDLQKAGLIVPAKKGNTHVIDYAKARMKLFGYDKQLYSPYLPMYFRSNVTLDERVFVVNGPIQIPDINNTQPISLIIPKGVPSPTGDIGNFTLHFVESGECFSKKTNHCIPSIYK